MYRSAKDARRLKLLVGGKPMRSKEGAIIETVKYPKGEDETKPGRVAPYRRWFAHTRVISQTALDHFYTSLSTRKHYRAAAGHSGFEPTVKAWLKNIYAPDLL